MEGGRRHIQFILLKSIIAPWWGEGIPGEVVPHPGAINVAATPLHMAQEKQKVH
jgi:hypothetical protein